MTRPLNYVLGPDGETPEPFDIGDPVDLGRMTEWAVTWARQRLLQQDPFPCGGFVSTIFTGIDGSIFGPPLLFETMAFDAEGKAAFQHRETTKRRALKTHAQVIAHVMEKLAK